MVKHVINDDGGAAISSDWTMNVAGPTPLSFAGSEAGTTNEVSAGDYVVTESSAGLSDEDRDRIAERWGVAYHERTIGKILDRLDFSHITTRPQHYRQDKDALEAFKKTSPTGSRRSAGSSLSPRP